MTSAFAFHCPASLPILQAGKHPSTSVKIVLLTCPFLTLVILLVCSTCLRSHVQPRCDLPSTVQHFSRGFPIFQRGNSVAPNKGPSHWPLLSLRRNKKQTAVINIRKYKRISGKKKGFVLTFRMFQRTSSGVVNR